MRGRIGTAVLAAALVSVTSVAAAPSARPPSLSTEHARAVLAPGVTPERYDLEVTPDAAAKVFTGRVAIQILIDAPTRTLTLNAADLTFSRVALSGETARPTVAFDPRLQTVTLTFPHVLAAGRRTLSIDYAGRINPHAAGLFALDYDAPASVGGGRKRALFTQFENSDARRFIPSWDEPNRKAVFALTATVPADLMAVSNMPAVETTPVGGGLKRVRFAPSAKMSSYLLFFGLGDFERIHRDVDGVDVGVIVKRGAGEQGRYALDAAAHILPYYNDYFGVKYPLPKLDLIAGSGESQFFGAMENWGAIFFFDRDVLVDQTLSTEQDRQNVYLVVAHEMAHQWFGDLVTMDWWDDLWLNEGFASWMENKAVDHFHPEWKLWLQAAASKEAAMRLDARRGTHPVITPIADVLQAQQAFDTITYEKGEAVIRMLEAYVGEDAWRAGVRRYVARHAYANSVTDDLWREVDAVSPRKITDIAHDFTLQAGVPLVTATIGCVGDRASGGALLVRGGFSVDGSSAGESWRIPVEVAAWDRSSGASLLTTKPVSVVLDRPQTAVRLDCAGPVLVNAGQTGYFRTLYKNFGPLKASFAQLPSADQLGLLNDTAALGAAGYAPYADVLDLTAAVPPQVDPVVGVALVARTTAVDALYGEADSPARRAWRAHARRVVGPMLARLGWRAKPGEAPNVAALRASVIAALGRFDDPEVAAEARRRFAAYLAAPTRVDPAERRSLLDLVAANADAATWNRLHALARAAPSALEKAEAYARLGTARDPELARRALELAMTSEPETTTSPSMIKAVARAHPAMALDFAIAHAPAIDARLEPDSRNQYIPQIAASATDLQAIDRLDAYAAAHIPSTAQGEVVKARSAIRYVAGVRARVTPQVDAWIAAHPG